MCPALHLGRITDNTARLLGGRVITAIGGVRVVALFGNLRVQGTAAVWNSYGVAKPSTIDMAQSARCQPAAGAARHRIYLSRHHFQPPPKATTLCAAARTWAQTQRSACRLFCCAM